MYAEFHALAWTTLALRSKQEDTKCFIIAAGGKQGDIKLIDYESSQLFAVLQIPTLPGMPLGSQYVALSLSLSRLFRPFPHPHARPSQEGRRAHSLLPQAPVAYAHRPPERQHPRLEHRRSQARSAAHVRRSSCLRACASPDSLSFSSHLAAVWRI